MKILRKITFIRRVSQIIFFVFIFYGTYILFLKQTKINTIKIKNIIVPEKQLSVFLPIRSCRFAKEGPFKGCVLFFISKSLSVLKFLKRALPHFLLFLVFVFCFGRLWCGWVCPVGFISEILYEIRKFLGVSRVKLGINLRKSFKVSSYILLCIIITTSIMIASPNEPSPNTIRKALYLVSCQICPSRIITPLITGYPLMVDLFSSLSILFFVLCILFSIIYLSGFIFKRVWCKLCPLGAVLSFFNKGALLTKEKDFIKCSRCGICADACPMETKIVYEQKDKKSVDHSQCIHCFRCVDLCPERDCLKVKFVGLPVFKS